ncbi:MAG: butyrate kinase [Christensenellales bacterium]
MARVPEKPDGAPRILAINPGSTSTKFALYDSETMILTQTIRHDRASLDACGSILAQKDFRKQCVIDALNAAGADLCGIDAIAGRGGLLKPIESGTYLVNAAMLRDLNRATDAIHASALGAIIANEIAASCGKPAYVVDPVVVDEMDRHAKLTGMPGIERSSVFHALNQKAIARRLAKRLNKPYENCRFVVAHLGGGITVGAHRYGRVIDVNDALSGEGAFTPERSGSIPAVPLIKLCFSGEFTQRELIDKVTTKSGMSAYLGTNDMRNVERMMATGDEFAALVLDSMAYQVAKEIGAMCAVLEGRVDAIVLTGGLAHSNRFTSSIKQRVDRLAAVYVFPGEDEVQALMHGVLRVLRGEERAAVYE